jgi:hypothetical protein
MDRSFYSLDFDLVSKVASSLRCQTVNLAHAGEGAADVRDGDRAADNQSDIQCVYNFVALPAFFPTPNQMIGYAVIAA